jgi:hypothetical protein
MEKFNEIYDDRNHKCTFDIPVYLYLRITDKVKRGSKYNRNKSAYFRELLERDLMSDRLPTKEEYKAITRTGEEYQVDPPRRFSGFAGGLLRNAYKL